MTKRIFVSVTDDFYQYIRQHQQRRGLKSLAAALVDLAAIGAESINGDVPAPRESWGGDRKSPEWRKESE